MVMAACTRPVSFFFFQCFIHFYSLPSFPSFTCSVSLSHFIVLKSTVVGNFAVVCWCGVVWRGVWMNKMCSFCFACFSTPQKSLLVGWLAGCFACLFVCFDALLCTKYYRTVAGRCLLLFSLILKSVLLLVSFQRQTTLTAL